jgi:hypothetical protein
MLHDSLFHSVQTSSGAHQPPIQWTLQDPSPGVKRPGREADDSFPSSVEAKNGGAIPPLPNMSSWLDAWLIKHRDNFTFTFKAHNTA